MHPPARLRKQHHVYNLLSAAHCNLIKYYPFGWLYIVLRIFSRHCRVKLYCISRLKLDSNCAFWKMQNIFLSLPSILLKLSKTRASRRFFMWALFLQSNVSITLQNIFKIMYRSKHYPFVMFLFAIITINFIHFTFFENNGHVKILIIHELCMFVLNQRNVFTRAKMCFCLSCIYNMIPVLSCWSRCCITEKVYIWKWTSRASAALQLTKNSRNETPYRYVKCHVATYYTF